MKAIVADRYGPPEVLEFREVDKQENDLVHLAEVPVRQLKSAVKRPLNGTRHGTHLRNGRRVTQERHAVDVLSKNVIVAHHDFRAPLKIRRAWRLRRSRPGAEICEPVATNRQGDRPGSSIRWNTRNSGVPYRV